MNSNEWIKCKAFSIRWTYRLLGLKNILIREHCGGCGVAHDSKYYRNNFHYPSLDCLEPMFIFVSSIVFRNILPEASQDGFRASVLEGNPPTKKSKTSYLHEPPNSKRTQRNCRWVRRAIDFLTPPPRYPDINY